MNSALHIKDTRPKKDFSNITQLGLKALNLAVTHKQKIEPRLPGAIDALSSDLNAMSDVVAGALQARHEAIASTAAQNTLVHRGYERIRAIRETVRKSGAPADVRRAYGVGLRITSTRLRDVKAGLQQIVGRAASAVEEAAAFGMLPEDVQALTKFVESLADVDMTQETMRASVPLTTKERNRTANRITQAVVLIAGAGRIAFADDPATFASFAALMASSKRSAKAKAPKPKTPEEESPKAKSPEVTKTPEEKSPEAKSPEVKVPEGKASEGKAPEATESAEPPKAPETSASAGSAPQQTWPSSERQRPEDAPLSAAPPPTSSPSRRAPPVELERRQCEVCLQGA